MPEEKQPEPGWRERIDQPDTSGLDKNRAWESLQLRLSAEKPGRKMAWYWMAAASVLLLASAWFLIPVRTPHPGMMGKKNPEIKAGTPTVAVKRRVMQGETAQSIPNSLRIKRPGIKGPGKSAIKEPDLVVPDAVTTTPANAGNAPTSPAHDTLMAVAKPKPALRVVHLNELEDGAADESANNYASQKRFGVKLSASEATASHLMAGPDTEKSMFKIRINPHK